MTLNFILPVLSYLIGSCPTAYILTMTFKKVDIRKTGSGNVGGINTLRTAGLLPGLLTGLGDVGKGILVVLLVRSFSDSSYLLALCSLLVIFGHNFSIYIGFKGGKGLATTFGVLIVLFPFVLLWAIVIALLLTFLLRDTNTAFGYAALCLPIIFIFLNGEPPWVIFGAAAALVIALKHLPDFRAYRIGRRKLL
ncbi:MAG: glycerol-3-phosphate acyltransferase [Bacillota bacterium]